jgi:hypothetical protein
MKTVRRSELGVRSSTNQPSILTDMIGMSQKGLDALNVQNKVSNQAGRFVYSIILICN